MLKFSGFSDLTSCLEQGSKKELEGGIEINDQQREHQKMCFKLSVDTATTHTLNASRAPMKEHPDAQTRTTDETTEVELVSGMKWSRH